VGLRVFELKKVKKVRDINLTSAGFGKLDINGTFEQLAGI